MELLRLTILFLFFLSSFGVSYSVLVDTSLNVKDEFDREEVIGDNDNVTVTVAWHVNLETENITFEVTASTEGWVGFGISETGGMLQADMCVGGVNDADNEPYFTDRFGFNATHEPIKDEKHDWNLINAYQKEGNTTLHFWRKFNTSDEEHDLIITNKTVYLLWAVGENDNIELSHSSGMARGSKSINLLAEISSEDDNDETTTVSATATDNSIPESTTGSASYGKHITKLLIHFAFCIMLLHTY